MKQVVQSLRAYLVLTVLLGLGYPLLITFIAQRAMPARANGSLLKKGNMIVGSSLIGQGFARPEYFQSRPSANSYDGTTSGGTNLGPASRKLMADTGARIARARRENGLQADVPVPADMVLSSASGLDPHISLKNALLQAPRIAKLRGMPLADLQKMISACTDTDFLGIWGRRGVNILRLNMALDSIENRR